MIYLDNAATTPMDDRVLNEMIRYMTRDFGNAGSIHKMGIDAMKCVTDSRKKVAKFMNSSPCSIIFTSGGTESNNTVVLGTRKKLEALNKPAILTNVGEHSSVLRPISVNNIPVAFADINSDGTVSIESIKKILSDRNDIGLVSVMYVNNETGSVNDIKTIAEICRKYGVLFHTDCVQAAGSHIIDVKDIGCDFASVSSHKIHGPKGMGALYCRDLSLYNPIIAGGMSQEFGLRGGTENVPGIAGFAKACELVTGRESEILGKISNIKQHFYKSLSEELSSSGKSDILHVNVNSLNNPGKILSIRLDGIDSETAVMLLSSLGVCVSAGSACESLESEPSRILVAAGIDPEDARNSLRISFSEMNTNTDAEIAAMELNRCINTYIRQKIIANKAKNINNN